MVLAGTRRGNEQVSYGRPPRSFREALRYLAIWAAVMDALYGFVALTGIGAHRCSPEGWR